MSAGTTSHLYKAAYVFSMYGLTSTSVSFAEIYIRYILSLNGSPQSVLQAMRLILHE
jgi:hypothetical protein